MDYEYLFRKICERRGVTLSKVVNIALTTNVNFGLPNDTYILPVVANAFYFIEKMNMENTVVTIAGSAILRIPNIGGAGSAGDVGVVIGGAVGALKVFQNIEADSMRYQVQSQTAGGVNLSGVVYLVHYV